MAGNQTARRDVHHASGFLLQRWWWIGLRKTAYDPLADIENCLPNIGHGHTQLMEGRRTSKSGLFKNSLEWLLKEHRYSKRERQRRIVLPVLNRIDRLSRYREATTQFSLAPGSRHAQLSHSIVHSCSAPKSGSTIQLNTAIGRTAE